MEGDEKTIKQILTVFFIVVTMLTIGYFGVIVPHELVHVWQFSPNNIDEICFLGWKQRNESETGIAWVTAKENTPRVLSFSNTLEDIPTIVTIISMLVMTIINSLLIYLYVKSE